MSFPMSGLHISKYEIVLPLVSENGVEIEDFALLVNGIYGAFDVAEKTTAERKDKGVMPGASIEVQDGTIA